jgi:hypothetical protein
MVYYEEIRFLVFFWMVGNFVLAIRKPDTHCVWKMTIGIPDVRSSGGYCKWIILYGRVTILTLRFEYFVVRVSTVIGATFPILTLIIGCVLSWT